MKKFITLFLLPLFLCGIMLNVNAQKGYEDIIYLKNGTITKGVIIEQIPNVRLKIKTHDGNIFVYRTNEIEKCAKEKRSYHKSVNNWKLNQFEEFNKGYLGLLEFGGGIHKKHASSQSFMKRNTPKAIGERLDSVVLCYDNEIHKLVFTYNNKGYNTLAVYNEWINGNWVELLKDEYEYDNNGNLTLKVAYEMSNGNWVGYWKREYEYDSSGNQILWVIYGWNDGSLVKSSKIEQEYDDSGNLTLKIYYNWRNGNWVGFSKMEQEYDDSGNLTLSVEYNWRDGNWIEVYKYKYEYDDKGNRILWVGYSWHDGNWVEFIKDEYEYDNNGNQILGVHYLWHNGNWVNYRKYEYEYDDNGNQILFVYSLWRDGNWIGGEKREYGYDDNENQTFEVIYSWRNGNWIGDEKREYEYDDNGNQILFVYSWWRDDGNWVESSKMEQKYDLSYSNLIIPYDEWGVGEIKKNNKLLQVRNYQYSAPTGIDTYYWSSQEVGITETTNRTERILIYPNPTSNSFIIDFDKTGLIKLYDMLGKEVLTQTVNGKTEININHLPKGIYGISVISEGKIIGNSKIVKQ